MDGAPWLAQHWFDLLQSAGIIGGLLFTAYTIHRNERATRISNLIALNGQHGKIWERFYARPNLARVLKMDVDLSSARLSDDEHLFVKMLILHLNTVYRAARAGVFVKMKGLRKDVREFFSFPIPRAIWDKIKPFQDDDFVAFVESCLRPDESSQ